MKIIVLSRRQVEVPEYYHKMIDMTHILLSIGPEKATVPMHLNRIALQHLNFDDVDNYEIARKHGLKIMDQTDAAIMFSFIRQHRHSTEAIIFQCEAGISRSAGAAAAWDLILNGEDKHWFNSRYYLPNSYVYGEILRYYNNLLYFERAVFSGHTHELGVGAVIKRFLRTDLND